MTDKKVDADGFLPSDYTEPEGDYMKLQLGENTFRVLSKAVTGFLYWTEDNKPVRAKEDWAITPKDIRMDKGEPTPIKHFWVFAVWNNRAKKVQVLEITQKTIQASMKAYIRNEKWGDPKGYDFTITRTGSGMDTEYVTMANPHSPAVETTVNVNLEAIFDADASMFVEAEAKPTE